MTVPVIPFDDDCSLTKDQRAKARRLGISYEEMEARLDDWYTRKERRDAERPRLEAEKAERALRREAEETERIHRDAEKARRAAERARQHEAVLAERAAARAAEADRQRQRRLEAEYKRIQTEELAALSTKVDDGRKYDEHGITIERSTGKPVVRTTHPDGVSSYSCNPVTGFPWEVRP